jgi:dTDP-glucose 4,6-dehydratase
MMKIMLITGGAGFKGSNFIKYFLKRNRNFIVVDIDRQPYPYEMNRLEELENSPRYHHIKGDICNRDLVEYVLRKYKPSWIVNFCCEPGWVEEPKNFRANEETGFTGTLSLLEGARHAWARTPLADKRFLQISTDEVYGCRTNEKVLCDENAPLSPESPYSAIKAGADLMTSAYFKAFGMPVLILRSCSTYGPWQELHRPVPSLLKKIAEGGAVSCVSCGPEREWLHISDLCSAITRTLFFARPGETYNVGSGEAATEAELAASLLKLSGREREKPFEPVKCRKSGSIRRLDSEKARYRLKWTNSYSLEEGLQDTVKWYESHRIFKKP